MEKLVQVDVRLFGWIRCEALLMIIRVVKVKQYSPGSQFFPVSDLVIQYTRDMLTACLEALCLNEFSCLI